MNPVPEWVLSPSVLRRMVGSSAMGMAVVDEQLTFVWANRAMEEYGVSTEDRLGRRLADIQPGLDSEAIEAQMRHVLSTGESVKDFEHVGHVRSDPGREYAHTMSFTRLEDDEGRPLGVFYTVLDVTERHRSRNRIALLDRASSRIGRSLDVLRTGQELADLAVPELADFVTVDLLDTVISGGEPGRGGPAGPGDVPLRRAGHQSVGEGIPEAVVPVGGVARYHPWAPVVRCLLDGRTWRAEHIDPGMREWAEADPGGRVALLSELGLHTAMVVPVRARGVTLGVTSFFRHTRQLPFNADDQHLAEEFVARAAVSIDNARRYTRERDAALALQRSLLPHRFPEQEAVRATSRYRPADALSDVGGDWFDVLPLSGARVALVVGDILGHGITAAATMGRLRTAVQTLADLDLRPDEVLAHLDDLVTAAAREDDDAARAAGAQAVGASCLYAVYDPVNRQCVMASAGHPVPALVTPAGAVGFPDCPVGPALGVGSLPFESVARELEEGTTLVLYTDGLLAPGAGEEPGTGPSAHRADGTPDGAGGDGRRPQGADDDGPGADDGTGQGEDGRPDGEREAAEARREPLRRVLEELSRGTHSLEELCDAVFARLVPDRPSDDVALLVAGTRTLGTDRVATWELTGDPEQVGDVRRRAAEQLASWDLEHLAFTTELIVSELVTNAIRHAAEPRHLRLILSSTLITEVADSSSTSPHLKHPRTTDEGGRGLFLTSQCTERWGTRYTDNGKIIWAEQRLDAPASVDLAASFDLVDTSP